MIYPETFEIKLGFDQIRTKLKGYCLSTAGQEFVEEMRFSTDFVRSAARVVSRATTMALMP
jgi:DNA mismatch repair protein MutS2